MTQLDRPNDCSVCKKRRMSSEGVVCSLTNAKPTFENQCPDYEEDNPAAVEQARLRLEASLKSMPGDLKLLLWLCFGLSLLVCTFGMLATLVNGLLFASFLLLVCVLLNGFTIYAFYQRKSYAVSLANTAIGIGIIRSVYMLILCVAFANEQELASKLIACVWFIAWYIYLQKSNEVDRYIPKSERSGKVIQWVILSLVVLLYIFASLGVIYVVQSGALS
jgi:hypothetical protein